MSDVFISYSRKDGEFVQRLNTAFVNVNRIAWVDWQNIPRGENWRREIELGIETADAFICVISKNWLTSEICHAELQCARQNNKRVLPLIRQKIEGDAQNYVEAAWNDPQNTQWCDVAKDNWEYIRGKNWILFENDDITRFLSEFNALLKALDEDQPHIKAHTRYQNRALEWQRSGQNPSFLLAGDDLTFAEKWLSDGATKQPQPTTEHRAYITASRDAENSRNAEQAARESSIRWFRLGTIVFGIVGVIAIIATLIASKSISDALIQLDISNQIADASLYIVEGKGWAALQIADALVKQYPNQGQAYMEKGLIEANAKQLDAAIADYSQAIQLNPHISQPYNNRGLAYAGQGKLDKAVSDYTQAIQLNSQDANVYNNRGNAYADQGELDKAIADYTQSILLNPQSAEAYFNRGVAYGHQGNLGKAIIDYTQAIKLNSQIVPAYSNRGLAYHAQGQLDLALMDFDQAIKLNLQDANIYLDRGNVYLDQEKLDLAIADYNQSIQLNPQLANAYGAKGYAEYLKNQFTEALADWDTFEKLGGVLPQQLQDLRVEMQAAFTTTPPP